MSNILNIFLCVIVGIILFVAIVYSIEAAQAIASYSGYETDDNLATAHRYLSYTSSILLIVVAALIIGIISLFIWGAELIPRFGSTIVDFVFLIVILAAILLVSSRQSLRMTSANRPCYRAIPQLRMLTVNLSSLQ